MRMEFPSSLITLMREMQLVRNKRGNFKLRELKAMSGNIPEWEKMTKPLAANEALGTAQTLNGPRWGVMITSNLDLYSAHPFICRTTLTFLAFRRPQSSVM